MAEQETGTRVPVRSAITAWVTGVPAVAPDGSPASGGEVWIPPTRPVWWQRTRGLLLMTAAIASVLTAQPGPRPGTWQWIVTIALCGVCVVSRIPIMFRRGGAFTQMVTLVVTGLGGVALSILSPHSAATGFSMFAVINATELWSVYAYFQFAAVLCVMYGIVHLRLHGDTATLLLGPVVIAFGVLTGVVRRQSAELAEDARQFREAQARSAALDERARIAREIHDVLAHSLAALTVQLETADALLETGRNEQAHTSVLRAGQLAREGLAETRRAIGAV